MRLNTINLSLLFALGFLVANFVFVWRHVIDRNNRATEAFRSQSKSTMRTTRMASRLILITAMFGEEQPLLPLFLKSASRSGLDVLLFGDYSPSTALGANVRYVRMSWKDLLLQIGRQIPTCFVGAQPGWWTNFTMKRKIIDFKPLFAKILQDHIAQYDVWGYGDNDLFLGAIRKFLTDDVLSKHDVIPLHYDDTDHKVFGPATFFRNSEVVNNLFRRAPRLCDMMRDPRPWGFDEWYGMGSRNNMDGIVRAALADPRLGLRFYGWPHPHNFWDAYDRFVWPPNVSLTCELRCGGAGPCLAIRQCARSEYAKCTRVEVALCHFQTSKAALHRQLRNLSSTHRAQLLGSDVVFASSERGVYRPSPAEVDAADRRGLSARGNEELFVWGRPPG